MNKDGSRTIEPDPMPFETSQIWKTVLQEYWNDKVTRADIAKSINIPEDEFHDLVFGLAVEAFEPEIGASKPILRLVS
jgi:hypothetical protein